MRKLWSNTCERRQSKEKEQSVDSSYSKGIEVLLRETPRKATILCWWHLTTILFVHPDESWSSKTDLWIRPTDLFWHFSTLMTIREMPFRNFRGRSLTKLEARDECKKQKTLKKKDKAWNSARWNQSSWTWATSSLPSAWREWSSHETHEQESKDTTWQSHFSWH